MGSGLECESPTKGVVGDLDSGLVGVCREGVLKDEPCSISRNWLTLEGAFSTGSASSRMSNHKNKKNKDMCNIPFQSLLSRKQLLGSKRTTNIIEALEPPHKEW